MKEKGKLPSQSSRFGSSIMYSREYFRRREGISRGYAVSLYFSASRRTRTGHLSNCWPIHFWLLYELQDGEYSLSSPVIYFAIEMLDSVLCIWDRYRCNIPGAIAITRKKWERRCWCLQVHIPEKDDPTILISYIHIHVAEREHAPLICR
jgi:hypothetical protein